MGSLGLVQLQLITQFLLCQGGQLFLTNVCVQNPKLTSAFPITPSFELEDLLWDIDSRDLELHTRLTALNCDCTSCHVAEDEFNPNQVARLAPANQWNFA